MENEMKPSETVETARATAPEEELTTLNLNQNQSQSAITYSIAAPYKRQALSGANWFFWIAALSLINSVVLLANGRWSFLAGLGITQIIDGIAMGIADEAGGTATIIAFVLDLMVAGVFVVIGLFARKHHTWAFILGMCLYALDAVIFLLAQVWFGLAFHAFVLYSLFRGLSANNRYKQLMAEAQAQ